MLHRRTNACDAGGVYASKTAANKQLNCMQDRAFLFMP